MAQLDRKQKTIVIGAGPVGALAALYAAQRGDDVEIYELRDGTLGFSISIANVKESFETQQLLQVPSAFGLLLTVAASSVSLITLQRRGTTAAEQVITQQQEIELFSAEAIIRLVLFRLNLRLSSTRPLNFTRTINLALSERGISALRKSTRPDLLTKVFNKTIPMRGRMIHRSKKSGELFEIPQDYDIYGRTIFSVDRGELNKILLDELDVMPNVKFYFNHKLTGADFRGHKAWFEVSDGKSSKHPTGTRDQEVEVNFDFLIGADGAHSAARFHMFKYVQMDYQQVYIDTLWCEFTMLPKEIKEAGDPKSAFRISPNHLHIWPGKEFMFVAIPNPDGSFACTIFMPSTYFTELENDTSLVPTFFDTNFPGVTSLIKPEELITSFTQNPHLPLISIKCKPYHFRDSAVIIGDAAHAMVPFFGQGMNAGLEDVEVLFSILDKHVPHALTTSIDLDIRSHRRAEALAEYSEVRRPDAHAIADLALENFTEMRASVLSPIYLLRKWLEERLSLYLPSLGCRTRYSRVTFGHDRYSEVVRKSERQGRMLVIGLVGALTGPVVLGVLLTWGRWRRHGSAGFLNWHNWLSR